MTLNITNRQAIGVSDQRSVQHTNPAENMFIVYMHFGPYAFDRNNYNIIKFRGQAWNQNI